MRIVRLANFVAPRSGGLRTALHELGAGYMAAGHEPVLVVPGERDGDEQTAQGRVITMRGPVIPFSGGYRVLLRKRYLARLLESLRPDRLEVSDRTTLRWTGQWASRHGVPAVMVSHESVAGLLGLAWLPALAGRPGLAGGAGLASQPGGLPGGPLARAGLAGGAGLASLPGGLPGGPLARAVLARAVLARAAAALADALNARTAGDYERVICTTRWAAAEFERLGVSNLLRVPLGVDLDVFTPDLYSAARRERYAAPHETLLVHCGRLSVEKKPHRSIDALAALRGAGVPAVLVVAGDGPLRGRLERRAARAGLPVRFTGFLAGRGALASLFAVADVALAPGPVETFGLAALEALACGTPAVVSATSALPEVIGDAGVAVAGEDFAGGVRAVLSLPVTARRAAARARAAEFGWPAAIAGFLAAHGVAAPGAGVPCVAVLGCAEPGAGAPGAGVPGAGVPGFAVPGAGVPGAGVPGFAVPGAGVPDAGVSGAAGPVVAEGVAG